MPLNVSNIKYEIYFLKQFFKNHVIKKASDRIIKNRLLIFIDCFFENPSLETTLIDYLDFSLIQVINIAVLNNNYKMLNYLSSIPGISNKNILFISEMMHHYHNNKEETPQEIKKHLKNIRHKRINFLKFENITKENHLFDIMFLYLLTEELNLKHTFSSFNKESKILFNLVNHNLWTLNGEPKIKHLKHFLFENNFDYSVKIKNETLQLFETICKKNIPIKSVQKFITNYDINIFDIEENEFEFLKINFF